MSNDLWQQYQEADRLHSAGLISDDEVNLAAGRYSAHSLEKAAATRPKRTGKEEKKRGRPRARLGSEERPMKDVWLDATRTPPPLQLSSAVRARPPEERREAAIEEERDILWDVVLVTAHRGDHCSMREWSHQIASTYLAPEEQKEESRQMIERWLGNPGHRRLPRWLRAKLEPLFPRRPTRSV